MNFLISICQPDAKSTLLSIAGEAGAAMPTVLYGRGTAVRSMLDLLGIEENERRVLFCLCSKEQTEQMIRQMKEKLFLGVPGHGIAVALPVKSIAGGKTVEYLTKNRPETVPYTPKWNPDYELIVAIANKGCTDTVMNAARKAGARGGTVLHGKGTLSEEQRKFFRVGLADEKEVLLIVSSAAQKAEIMRRILCDAGPDSAAGTVAFSLPIGSVSGFGFPD